MKMKKIFALLMMVLCLALVAGCGGSGEKKASSGKMLRVGTNAEYPPFEFFQEKSKAYTGFDIEIMNMVARKMGYDGVEYVNMPFDNLIGELKDQKVDAVISCLSITEERKKEISFTSPYLRSSSVLILPVGFAEGNSDSALKDKKIAVAKGTIHVPLAGKHTKNVLVEENAEKAIALVMNKKADMAIVDQHMAAFMVANTLQGKAFMLPYIGTHENDAVGIAVNKGNDELLKKMDEALKDVQHSSEFMLLKKTYFGNQTVKG